MWLSDCVVCSGAYRVSVFVVVSRLHACLAQENGRPRDVALGE